MKLFRKDIEIDPATERELKAIDTALAGEPVDSELTDLALLAADLRQDRPVPRELFVAELDRRVADGFPPPRSPRGETSVGDGGFRRPAWLSWRALAPATAVAASLAIATVAVVSSGVFSDGGSTTPAGGEQAPVAVARQEEKRSAPAAAEEPAPADGAITISPPPPSLRGRGSDAIRNRQVERSASIVLATSPADVEDAADGVVHVTDKYDGFVETSEVSGGDASAAGATFVLRIPSSKVQDAIADLSELGHVRERTQSSDDITSEFVSVRSRTTRASSERQALLRQLAAADTPNEIAAAKAQLRTIDRRLASLRAEQKRLNNRVTFSTVDLKVQADASAAKGDGKFTPSDALHDARDILAAGLGVLLIALAILIPLGVVAAAAWLVISGLRRRGRERALDAADDR
jgi:hypothetical protein